MARLSRSSPASIVHLRVPADVYASLQEFARLSGGSVAGFITQQLEAGHPVVCELNAALRAAAAGAADPTAGLSALLAARVADGATALKGLDA